MHPPVVRRVPRFAAAAAAVAALLCAAPTAVADTVSTPVAQSPDAIRAFWTPQRMQAAQPLEIPSSGSALVSGSPGGAAGSRPAGRVMRVRATRGSLVADFEPGGETSFPNQVHGRVFFTFPNVPGLFSCSGTIIASLLRNVVLTAGHCAYDTETNQVADNWLFVPGYRDGAQPFGSFPASNLLITEEYATTGDLNFDIAIAQMGTPLENQLGARGVAFNKPPKTSYKIFGYPAEPFPTYDGERLIQCDAPFYGLEFALSHPFSTIAYPCNMTQGASGGGWVNPAGYVVSVSSHVYLDPALDDRIAGPYFGQAAKRLYNAAGGSAECPPATKALKKAKTVFKKARKADRRRDSKQTAKKLQKANKRLSKAKTEHAEVC